MNKQTNEQTDKWTKRNRMNGQTKKWTFIPRDKRTNRSRDKLTNIRIGKWRKEQTGQMDKWWKGQIDKRNGALSDEIVVFGRNVAQQLSLESRTSSDQKHQYCEIC